MARTICSCSRVFDPLGEAKKKVGGPGDKCPTCSAGLETVPKYEGSMIFSHKTAPSLEVRLQGNVVHEAEPGETRRGGVPERQVTETKESSPFLRATSAMSLPEAPLPKNVTAHWYDPVERQVYQVRDGVLFSASLPERLIFTKVSGSNRNLISKQKGRILEALRAIVDLMKK